MLYDVNSEKCVKTANNQNTMPRISVVTPSLNQTRFLEETISSVISQNYPNTEYIIIDGGSTDGSQSIIRKYESSLSYWISEPDKGQSSAINKGFSRCTGDIITFLSSDDIYLPHAFFFVAEQWQKHPECGAIVGGFKFLNEKSALSSAVISPYLPYQTPIDLSLIPPEKWRLHQVSTFYSRKALDQVGRYVCEDLRYVMDRELLFRVAKNFEIVLDERPYAAFRRHSESKSMSSFIPFGEEFGRLYLESPSNNKKDQKFKRKLARFYHAKGFLHLAKYHPDLAESNRAFTQAVKIYPEYLLTRKFWLTWVKRVLKMIQNND